VVARIKRAKKSKEKVIVYGDYDADGICATAIMWEALHKMGVDATPFIPDRFSDGYGLNSKTIKNLKLKSKNLKLIVTVDNGIVAHEAVETANKLKIDVIISDHHQPDKKLPEAFAIVHTDKICGSAVSWITARELGSITGLELAGIGTISDQMPLLGPNRSFAKYGLEELRKTNRCGIREICEEAKINQGKLGTYEVNFLIAPRINSMGRLAQGMDSLRLICTRDPMRAKGLAKEMATANWERQRILDEAVTHAREVVVKKNWKGVIIVAHESYHEGIIGLVASRLTEEFYRPVIVISKGEEKSKASARSISGFNIIENIRKLQDLILEGGGHPMAAGFNIETKKILEFSEKMDGISSELLTKDLLVRKLRIDMEIDFKVINWDMLRELKEFDPTGLGNPTPTFVTRKAEVVEARVLGDGKKHLKLKVKKADKFFDAIAFGWGEFYSKISKGGKIDLVYSIEENVWNGSESIQLKIRDLSFA
jgi:single-stranded-DNA-specific exonuclease